MGCEKVYKFIIAILTILLFIALAGFDIQTHRLASTRFELESVRTELESAEDKQSRIRDIVRGTDEILSESFYTIEGIRSQIRTIRESYEEMEALLNDSNAYSSRLNNLGNKE